MRVRFRHFLLSAITLGHSFTWFIQIQSQKLLRAGFISLVLVYRLGNPTGLKRLSAVPKEVSRHTIGDGPWYLMTVEKLGRIGVRVEGYHYVPTCLL